MENILNLLELFYQNLKSEFDDKKNVKKDANSTDDDLLSTIVSLNKNAKNFRELLENCGISHSQLSIKLDENSSLIDSALERGYIKKCQLTLHLNKYYISFLGIHYYLLNTDPSNYSIENVLTAFEKYRLPDQNDIQINKYEKLIVLFLIIVGADNERNAILLKSNEFEKNCFQLLRLIESKCIENEINLGGNISWGTGKNIGFKRFIGNNDKLPKTMIFKKIVNEFEGYYLDLNSPGNSKIIIDLITGQLNSVDKLLMEFKLKKMINDVRQLTSNILEEITPEINLNILNCLGS
jgi:hypothetical protein